MAALRECRASGITLVPVLNADGTLRRIIDLSVTPTQLPLRALLMAGGKGERLRPMTLTTPKPLLEIDGKAIIDYNVEALAAAGVTDITVSTAYMADAIDSHFASPVAGVQVRTTISFEEMYLHHAAEHADITVAAIPYAVSVPYAILTTDGARVTGIDEKPTYSHYANAGIYIFRNAVLRTLRAGERTDATDLIERCISGGGRVAYYPIRGTWIDVGSPADFRQASELMRHHRNLSAR